MNSFSTIFPHYNFMNLNNLNTKLIKNMSFIMTTNGGKNGNNSK